MDSNDYVTVKYSSHLLQEDDSRSIKSFSTDIEFALKPPISIQDWLLSILRSTRYQIFVISLVVLDTLIVITELLLDLEFSKTGSQIPIILHFISLSLLCGFILEIFVKIYAYRLNFLSLKSEIFDAFVIIVAFILDVLSLHSEDAFAGSGLIIILRLWRVVRIQNSMVMSVHVTGEKKLSKERELRKNIEVELELTQEKLLRVKQYCRDLINILKENGLSVNSSMALSDVEN